MLNQMVIKVAIEVRLQPYVLSGNGKGQKNVSANESIGDQKAIVASIGA